MKTFYSVNIVLPYKDNTYMTYDQAKIEFDKICKSFRMPDLAYYSVEDKCLRIGFDYERKFHAKTLLKKVVKKYPTAWIETCKDVFIG